MGGKEEHLIPFTIYLFPSFHAQFTHHNKFPFYNYFSVESYEEGEEAGTGRDVQKSQAMINEIP